jgi:hypothetical protein
MLVRLTPADIDKLETTNADADEVSVGRYALSHSASR